MAEYMVPLQGLILFLVILIILLIISHIIGSLLAKKGKKSVGKVIGGLLLLIYGLALVVGFWSLLGIAGPALNAEEVATQEMDGNFLLYDKGDLLTIRDNIARLDTVDIYNQTYYAVWFESSGTYDSDFNVTFDEDIRDNHQKGDLVLVFLEVANYNNSSDREALKIHAPVYGEPGAGKYQIWPSWIADIIFWLILIYGVIVVVLGLIGLKTKKPEEAVKVCPECGGVPTYIEQYQRYFCHACNKYVEPVEKEIEEKPSTPLPPPPMETQPEESSQMPQEPAPPPPPPAAEPQPEQEVQTSQEPSPPFDDPPPPEEPLEQE